MAVSLIGRHTSKPRPEAKEDETMRMFRTVGILALIALSLAGAAQEQPDPTNLQILPAGMSFGEVQSVMRSFALGLDVRCTYCHVANEAENKMDFASDEKEHKKTARLMMKMTKAINDQHLVDVRHHGVKVTCATCHNGKNTPISLQEVLEDRLLEAGINSAVAKYRQLRDKYYGRSAYDFGEQVLIDTGDKLRNAKDLTNALPIYKLNLEHYPNSYRTHTQVARVYRSLRDTTAAIRQFEIALEIEPRAEWIKEAIANLRK
jgi:tetratricopeptide (TPR) repeat protein